MSRRIKIVLTGGPSAGKTTVAEALSRAYWDKLILVPEAASILFRGGFPREETATGIMCEQRAIYHVQNELEKLKGLDSFSRSLICDRGTLDGLAYWPGTEEEFFSNMQSNMEKEIARYDWVLHLDTAGAHNYQASTLRKETFAEAQAINERVKTAWREHPRRLLLKNNRDFSRKITVALLAVEAILSGDSKDQVEKILGE